MRELDAMRIMLVDKPKSHWLRVNELAPGWHARVRRHADHVVRASVWGLGFRVLGLCAS